ncbi:TetR family transcriptional regulator [Nocardioides sp.]|uniref:TetR family transcriptional regulator n=1 Tax=Nocardioides sp. TaxID=35761 RepID=UPI003D0DE55A
MTSRRDELAQAATDFALEHGLIGLSLRPLAAAIGTSDRMLLYHFTDKDDLIASVLRVSVDWSVATLRALPPAPDVRAAVLALWAAMTSDRMDRCQRMYVEAAALGLLGREPYFSVIGEANTRWTEALADQLVAAGSPVALARRAVVLLDAAFMGFQLDLPLDAADPVVDTAVEDLADAVVAITSAQGSA